MDIKKVIHAINKDKISKNIQDEMLRELKKATVYYNKWCSKVQDHEQLLLRLNIEDNELNQKLADAKVTQSMLDLKQEYNEQLHQ
jgi:hypothetical protein